MSKYLVTFKVNDAVYSNIYECRGNMTSKDIIDYEDKMTKKYTSIVSMLSFNKLSDEEKKVEVEEKEHNTKLATFILYDLDEKECVLVYTAVDNVISYTFEKGKMIVTLKDVDNINAKPKKYVCGIPGIWFGDENVIELIPEGIRKEFNHTYLFSYDYDRYETIK